MPYIIDGKQYASDIAEELKVKFAALKAEGINPCLTIFTSDNPASKVYVRNKVKKGEELGVEVKVIPVTSCKEIGEELTSNKAPFIVQLPNDNLDKQELATLLNLMNYRDVDGFSISNAGLIATGNNALFYPCTPKGICVMLEKWLPTHDMVLNDLNVLVIGRSEIVGKPLSWMLMNDYNCTVTVAHSHTERFFLEHLVWGADIIISAVGKTGILEGMGDNVEGAILIDVGINRNEDGKLCGDFAPEVLEKCYAYSPVPGGVGPMTVIQLFSNVYDYFNEFTLTNTEVSLPIETSSCSLSAIGQRHRLITG